MSRLDDDSVGGDRHLILMRHAKSDWSDPGLSDHERPLNKRGRRDAPRMGQWLADLAMVPDWVLSSDSQRTRETFELMSQSWPSVPPVHFSPALYLASPESILEVVRSDACDANRLMVIGHNPGMAYLVSQLADQSIDMPTAAVAVFRCAVPFSQLRIDSPVELVHYMKPKAL